MDFILQQPYLNRNSNSFPIMQNTNQHMIIDQQSQLQKQNGASPSNPGQPIKHFHFETQTKRLKQYYHTHQNQLIGSRILFNNNSGVVRYFGELKHQGKPADSNQLWIGIEWDQSQRGKHNGTVNGFVYFTCPQKQGSLIKYQKIQFGYKLQTALFKRYFKPQQLHQAKNIYEQLKQLKSQPPQPQPQSQSQSSSTQVVPVKKVHKIEYDAQAYINTIKQKKKIMIEFVGFDQIWSKINNLDKIQSISLAECRICDLGPLGNLKSIFKNLKILSLEDNLISDWNQIYHLGYELPSLSELSLSYNTLQAPSQPYQQLHQIPLTGREQSFDLQNIPLFPHLKTLILISTSLTWKTFFKIVPAFTFTQEFILCKNDMRDIENIQQDRVHYMGQTTFLNLQQTKLQKFQDIRAFGKLPKLNKLILNKNHLGQLGRDIKGFSNLRYLSVQSCNISKPVVLAQLAAFPLLQNVHVKHNPVGDKYGQLYVRMRAVAQMPKLTTINGALLKKYQRKDCQIFYLRQAFREYFAFKKVPDYNYDFQDFMKYSQEHHFNIGRLIKIYGNPYEVQNKKQIQEKIKEEVKVVEVKKGTGMVEITVFYVQKQLADYKKVPLSWTLSSLKNFFSKQSKIPLNLLGSKKGEEMTQDHKTLSYYNLTSGSKINVERRAQ